MDRHLHAHRHLLASMGPPPFGGGNAKRNGADKGYVWRLQWGHRLSAAETTIITYTFRARGFASMGPPPFGGGNPFASFFQKRCLTLASMGPPPFGGGNVRVSLPCQCRAAGFNGATAFRRRKLDYVCVLVGGVCSASMGPPPFGGGNMIVAVQPNVIELASMGPPPFGGGNIHSDRQRMIYKKLLQWGHRLSAAETGASVVNDPPKEPASMGPPPFGGGNLHPGHLRPVLHQASMGPPPFGGGNGRLVGNIL